MNQVFLGNSDPFLANGSDLATRFAQLQQYEANMNQKKINNASMELVWDKIDIELESLTDTQKEKLFGNPEYFEVSSKIATMVQKELVNLVKNKIENTKEGKELLDTQYALVKTLKKQIVQDSDNEMYIFNKFREASKANPELTYEEFTKQWQST